jgi:O-antigen ligase
VNLNLLALGSRLWASSNILLYALILLIPTQLGIHFWPEFSYIKGIRVDYLSPTLYLTDILIFLLFIIWLAKSHVARRTSQNDSNGYSASWRIPITFLLIIIFGIVFSQSPGVGFYGLIKLFEFIFLGFYIAKNIHKLKFEIVLLMFGIAIIFESVLAIAQFFNHGSIQGIFYFFGERYFDSQTLNIANASIGGELILRPYGTFSHPNVLAGYLLTSILFVSSGLNPPVGGQSAKLKMFCVVALGLGAVALFLTLSRIAILLWILIIGAYLIKRVKRLASSFQLLVLFTVLMFLLFATPLGHRFAEIKLADESVVQRMELIKASSFMIKDNPLFGVGLNNFLVNLSEYQTQTIFFNLQPVHNIFILTAAETGIVGLGFFIWFTVKAIKRIANRESRIAKTPIILFSIFVLGMFDHYFLTLQQGQILMAFAFGLCWSAKLKG